MDVILIDFARDPMDKLYGAYRTCYTTLTPREVWMKIASGETPPEKVREFVQERLKTGHSSPLEQVVFWFGISGVSRALSHQLVRHRIGISFEQQSQRYVKYKNDDQFEFVTPPSIERADGDTQRMYRTHMALVADLYKRLCDRGIPNEDARFVLPNAMPTNFQIMVNFTELLHICDLRLCHAAQWEIRHMVGLMRAEVRRKIPELAKVMQPKCGEARAGFCDEDLKKYMGCPLSKVRPHKSHFQEWAKGFGNRALSDEDFQPEGT